MTRDMNNSERKTCPHKNNQARKQTENSTDEVPCQWHLELLTAHTKKTEANNY